MGLLDRFKKNPVVGKVGDVADSAGDKIADGVDKATDFIDDKTGGKMHDKLEKVDGLADKLRNDEAEDDAGES